MLERNFCTLRAGAVLLALALAVPVAASAEIFAWRTDDGGFAYADHRDKIPARYASKAVPVRGQRFRDYDRLTVQDSRSSDAVNERLRQRLEYLRAFNHPAPEQGASARAAGGQTTLTVATGSPHAPTLDIASGTDGEPIVVETVLGKGHGQLLTRSATLVTQGDRTLAVLKGRRNQHNLSDDIVDLDEAAGH